MAKRLAIAALPTEHPLAASSVSFICRLVYHISGKELAIRNILQLPKRAFQSSRVRLVASAIHALDESHQLDSVVSSVRQSLSSSKEIAALDFLATLGLLVSFLFQLHPFTRSWGPNCKSGLPYRGFRSNMDLRTA